MASQLPVLFTVKLTVYYRCMIALHFDVCKLKMAAKMSVKYLKINFHRKIWRNLLCMPFRTHSARPFRHWLSPLIRRGCQTAFIQPVHNFTKMLHISVLLTYSVQIRTKHGPHSIPILVYLSILLARMVISNLSKYFF